MHSEARESHYQAIHSKHTNNFLEPQPGKYWHLCNTTQNGLTGTQLDPEELKHMMPGLSEGSTNSCHATWALPTDTLVLTEGYKCQTLLSLTDIRKCKVYTQDKLFCLSIYEPYLLFIMHYYILTFD